MRTFKKQNDELKKFSNLTQRQVVCLFYDLFFIYLFIFKPKSYLNQFQNANTDWFSFVLCNAA